MIISLKEDDTRIGKYDADGAIGTWPDTDVMGKPYERRIATVRRVLGGFVCIDPADDGQIDAIIVEQPKRAAVKRADVSE